MTSILKSSGIRYGLLLIALVLHLTGQASAVGAAQQQQQQQQAALAPDICDDMCSSAQCNTPCYENLMEFENGNAISCLEWGVWDDSFACCGDGICSCDPNDFETPSGCSEDCGVADPYCAVCDPETQTGCSGDDFCTYDGCCMDPGTPDVPDPPQPCQTVFCHDRDDCCPGDYCYRDIENWNSGVCYPQR